MTAGRIIDALQCGHFNRDSFLALRAGGYSAVTPTQPASKGAGNRAISCQSPR